MRPILAGIETEYGLLVEGSGAEEQIDHSMALVRGYSGGRFSGWDYRHESPRADLRGFSLERLEADPIDSQFDRTPRTSSDQEVRSDRILLNGARFYNDHGHPEYSTPECWGLDEIALHDAYGETVVLQAAKEYEAACGRRVTVYKNNVDYHGASYGTHENYLVPRSLGFEALYRAVTPMLLVRQVLTGAGRVGSEKDRTIPFQMSQRADFLVESANAETLYRRPIFNTRDEPHADPRKHIRLHVISGDANMMPSCTARKVGLVKLALSLAEADDVPIWGILDPPSSFRAVSQGHRLDTRIELSGGSWTTPLHILESYLDAAEGRGWYSALIEECRTLLKDFDARPELFKREVDWAAKYEMLEGYRVSEGLTWDDPVISALDLEYHNVDPSEGLFHALVESGEVDSVPDPQLVASRSSAPCEGTRAFARHIALIKFPEHVMTLSWSSITFKTSEGMVEVFLDPERNFGPELESVRSVEEFIKAIGGN